MNSVVLVCIRIHEQVRTRKGVFEKERRFRV